MKKENIGSSFDDFLKEEKIYEPIMEDQKKLSEAGIFGSNAGKELRQKLAAGEMNINSKPLKAKYYDPLISAGNKAQIEKLDANKHKTGFDDIQIGYATNRINDKLGELYKEINKPPRDYEKIRHKAADIANFAHMIILKCDKEFKK